MTLRIEVRHCVPKDDSLRYQWNRIVQQMERPEVFYTYEWALSVSRAYKERLTPLLLLAYEDDALLGVAAFAKNQNEKELSFLSGFTADYCEFVCPPQRRAEVLSCFFECVHELDVSNIVLSNLPADSPAFEILQPGSITYRIFARPAYECSLVSIRNPEERSSVERSVRNKGALHYLKKTSSSIHHYKAYDGIAHLLPKFIQWHVARFGQHSNLDSPERQFFLFELGRQLAKLRAITVSELRIDNQTAGLWISFTYARHWFYYQTAFDPNFQRYSPGFCLALKIIQEACQSPEFDYLDFGLGPESYKKRLANTSRQTVQLTLARSRISVLKVAARYRATAAIKRSPRVEHTLRYLLRRETQTRASV